VINTTHPGVRVSNKVRAKHPEKLAIILQYQFASLRVFDTYFEVKLWFDGISERVRIPFAAIEIFTDPSASFILDIRNEGGA